MVEKAPKKKNITIAFAILRKDDQLLKDLLEIKTGRKHKNFSVTVRETLKKYIPIELEEIRKTIATSPQEGDVNNIIDAK